MAESRRDLSLRLALIVVDPRTYRTAFAADLEREVIQVEPLDLGAIAGPPPAAPVVLVWLPPDHPADELAHIARWRGSAALIGCAPTGSSADSERALAAGFDDFVAGRASTRELAGRIRALTRRVRPASPVEPARRLRHGSISIDRHQHRLWIGDEAIPVTPTELAVMAVLVTARGSTRTRTQILDEAWGEQGAEVGERAVDNVILRLRRKLGLRDVLITVRGVGFRLADR